MTNEQDIWVPLHEAFAHVEKAYAAGMPDNALSEEVAAVALEAITRRLADGNLTARASGFSYLQITAGKTFMDPSRAASIATLGADDVVPIEFWRSFVEASYKRHDKLAGDFSFSISDFDYTGSIEGKVSSVAVNWRGLPIIGRQPAPPELQAATEPSNERQPNKSRGGRPEKYDKAHALIFLAARAHNETLKDDNGELTVAHIANLLEEAFASEKEEDQPGRTWTETLARRVQDEIKRQKL